MAFVPARVTESGPAEADAPVLTVTRQTAEAIEWDDVEIVGTVELALDYNGDYVVDETGALVLVWDGPGAGNDTATQQRLGIMLQMTPSYTDGDGVPHAADDVDFPSYGAGLTARVDELWDAELEADITTDIVGSMSGDPGLDPTVPPSVVFEVEDPTYTPRISYRTVSGEYTTLPSFQIPNAGG